MVDKIAWKEFNGKSRKGTYIYVKSKGKKGAYYKYNVGDSIEGIVAYYESDKKNSIKEYKQTYGSVFEGKRDKSTALRRKAQRYKRHIGKKFSDVLSKGIGRAFVKDIHNASKKDLQVAKEIMLKDIVKDPEIRTLVATEENLNKLKHRMQVNLIVKDNTNLTLDVINGYGMTIEEVQSRVKQYLFKGLFVDGENYGTYFDKVSLSKLGKSNVENEGFIGRIDAELIFRKN